MTGVVNSSGDNHDEVLREVEEIDWTEDLDECAPSDEAVEDFDVGELECVDEEDEDRRVQEVRKDKPSSSRSHKEHKSSGERHNPYSRPKPRDASDSPRRGKNISPARISRDRRRKMEWLERKKRERRNGGQEDINIDELEEVDCCDDDDARSETTSTFSGATPSSTSQSLDDAFVDDDDPWAKRISQADTSVFSLDDDDEFPSLCEDLDVEVLKRAAQDTTEQERNRREKSPMAAEEKNEPPPMADSTTSPPEARRSPKREKRERVERILPAREERRGVERRESRRSLYEKRRKVDEEDNEAVNSTTGRRLHEATAPHAPRRVDSYAAGLNPSAEGKKRRTSGSRTERKEGENGVSAPTSAQIRNLLRQLDAREEEIQKRRTEQKRAPERKQSFPQERPRIRVRPQQPMRRSYL